MEFDVNNLFEGRSLTCLRGGRLVFTDLDFQIRAGSALMLHGRNGSGKSSLMRLMAGLLQPFSGSMSFNNTPVTDDTETHAARLHYVGHQEAIKSTLTVHEMLVFWSRIREGGVEQEQIARALNIWGIEAQQNTPGRFLSSGQRRRLALARLTISPAPLWLLDEPTVGLDRLAVAALETEIAAHRQAGGMVVTASHIDIETGDDTTIMDVGDYTPDTDQILAVATGEAF